MPLVTEINIAANLKRLRESAGLSQSQLAKKAGVEQVSISRWEAGIHTPTVEQLLKLCAPLRCTLYDLLGIEGPVAPEVMEIITLLTSLPDDNPVKKAMTEALKKRKK